MRIIMTFTCIPTDATFMEQYTVFRATIEETIKRGGFGYPAEQIEARWLLKNEMPASANISQPIA